MREFDSQFAPWQRRVLLYGSALIVAGSLLIWGTSQAASVSAESAQNEAVGFRAETALLETLSRQNIDPILLVKRGVELVSKEEYRLGSIYLRAMSLKDPNYRDAAVYAGFAELKRADQLWNLDNTLALDHTREAVRYLEIAQKADPIHGYTYELLEVGYKNLGKTELAAEAARKVKAFE